MRERISKYGTDFFLVLVAITAFGMAAWNSRRATRFGGEQLGLAKVEEGNTKLLSANDRTLAEVQPGKSLKNLDIIWVPESRSARLKFRDQSQVTLKPGTLLILRRRFKPHDKSNEFILGQGTVEKYPPDGPKETLVEENRPQEFPSPSTPPKELTSKDGYKYPVAPKNQTIIYRDPTKTTELPINWGQEIDSGTLAVVNSQTQRLIPSDFKASTGMTIAMPENGQYYWSVIQGEKRVLGPYHFEVRTLDAAAAKEHVLKADPNVNIQVFW